MLLAAILVPGRAHAQQRAEGCELAQPVLEAQLPGAHGEWQLPLSASQPEVLTHARMEVTLLPPASPAYPWTAAIRVSFPDPKPFGIPYSFEKLELRWPTASGPASALLDWSEQCTGPGRSMFPGQSWDQSWEIPGTEGLPTLDEARLSLWGSRN